MMCVNSKIKQSIAAMFFSVFDHLYLHCMSADAYAFLRVMNLRRPTYKFPEIHIPEQTELHILGDAHIALPGYIFLSVPFDESRRIFGLVSSLTCATWTAPRVINHKVPAGD